jgi:hypothetical protein
MTIQQRFKPEDLERIKKAVKEAESKISGEIVPVFVEKSSNYTIANYRAALIGAAAVFFLIVIFDRYVPTLAVYDPVSVYQRRHTRSTRNLHLSCSHQLRRIDRGDESQQINSPRTIKAVRFSL